MQAHQMLKSMQMSIDPTYPIGPMAEHAFVHTFHPSQAYPEGMNVFSGFVPQLNTLLQFQGMYLLRSKTQADRATLLNKMYPSTLPPHPSISELKVPFTHLSPIFDDYENIHCAYVIEQQLEILAKDKAELIKLSDFVTQELTLLNRKEDVMRSRVAALRAQEEEYNREAEENDEIVELVSAALEGKTGAERTAALTNFKALFTLMAKK